MRGIELRGNSQKLDGGALFGNAPRVLWNRWHEPDDQGRVTLECRALLVQGEFGNVLLETGIGAFFSPDKRDRYGVVESNHVLLDSLAAQGLSHEDVDAVILSHLHFDHAGGLLSTYTKSEHPTLLFPNATFITSDVAFARACDPHPRDRASFIPELQELLKRSERLLLVSDTQSSVPLLGDAFQFRQTHGHTPGMLHTLVRGPQVQLFFCADLIPGQAWVRPAISMGYDRFPELLIDEKSAVLAEVFSNGTWLFFTHDPTVVASQVGHDERGRYVCRNPLSSLSTLQL